MGKILRAGTYGLTCKQVNGVYLIQVRDVRNHDLFQVSTYARKFDSVR
jgi:hypothetical protein